MTVIESIKARADISEVGAALGCRVVAKELADFCWRMVQFLRAIRNNIYDAFNEAECLYRGSERVGDSFASEWRELRQRLTLANQLDGFITRLEGLSAAELIALRDRLEGAVAA